jgi:threonine dehydrogenase-like Zn-dependent dehydrogenase
VQAFRVTDSQISVVEVEPPDPADGVTVRVGSSGICGSDLSMIDLGWAPAVTMGHEIAGWTEDGTAVAIEPTVPCGTCRDCLDGRYNLCSMAAFTAVGVGRDGGWAEQLVVPERCLVPLPAGVQVADACLIEPLAVALHGLGLVDHRAADRTAIVGAGTIGLATLASVTSRGGMAAVVARHDHQAVAVEQLGGSNVVEGDYDLVVETAGTGDALAHAVRLAKPGGTVLLLSMHWSPTPTPGVGMWMKEVRLVPSMMYCSGPAGREIDQAAAALAGDARIGPAIITHRFPLSAAADAFAAARDRAAGSIKVVLEPS